MKKVCKVLLAAMIFLGTILLSFSVGAADPQVRYYTLPSSVSSDHLSIFPEHGETFYLLSSSESQTQLSLFDPQHGDFTSLLTDPLPYTAALLSPSFLVIASSTMDYDEEGQSFLSYTRMTYYERGTGLAESYIFPDLFLENSSCLAEDSYGLFYAVDRESPSTLLIFDRYGALQNSILCNGRIASVTSSPSGDQIYITYTDNRRFSYLDCSSPESLSQLVDLDTDSPILPYRFLDDTSYIDGTGDLYFLKDNRFQFSYSSLCPEPSPYLYQDFLLCFPEDGPLLYLNWKTGEAVAQSPDIEGTPLDFCVSGDTGIILLSSSGGYRLGCLELNLPKTLDPIVISPSYHPLSAEQTASCWENSLPVNLSVQNVYTQSADFNQFTHPASLSQPVLEDGLAAVNFYRALYGLSPLTLNMEGCESLAYGAVLSFWASEDGDIPEKPDAMPDSFYHTAQLACQSSTVVRQSALSPYPIAQAIHTLMEKSPPTRETLLSPHLTSVSFGAATAEDGSTCVLLSAQTDDTDDEGVTAYPSGGVFPQELADSLWSLSFDSSLLCGVRGMPTVTIQDLDNGTCTSRTLGDGLFLTQNGIEWTAPSPIPGHFTVQVHHLCTQGGSPVMIEYSGSLIPLDLSLPDPEDPSNPPESGQIGSSLYSIDREHGWIYGISPSTSAAAFRGNLAGEGEFTLLRNQQVISSGNAGTGMVIQLSQDGVVSDTLTLIVYGDVSGEGNVNTLDFRTLRDHLLEKEGLAGPFLQAADINHDKQVNTLDLLALEQFLSGEYDISQK